MFKIICVTNRIMCDDFLERIEMLYRNNIEVILREKDLTESEYEKLAEKVIEVCPDVILHTYIGVAKRLDVKKIHLPFSMMNETVKNDFKIVGVSIHSCDEAVKAEKMGADYVTAGHIYATDCKKEVKPRGIDFLKDVVNSVEIPVYGIGGITADNVVNIRNCGGGGGCIMSNFMKCENVGKYLEEINENLLKK